MPAVPILGYFVPILSTFNTQYIPFIHLMVLTLHTKYIKKTVKQFRSYSRKSTFWARFSKITEFISPRHVLID